MEKYSKEELAMLAGYFAIVNNSNKYKGAIYRTANGQDIEFMEAAKILLCKVKGIDPDEVILQTEIDEDDKKEILNMVEFKKRIKKGN